MNLFSEYNWFELWGPIWFVVLLGAAVWYLKNEGQSVREKSLFLIALALIYIVVGSPFQVVAADGLFSAFMFQQSVLYLVVPPFLISGIPSSWLRPQLWHHTVKSILRILTHPWFTAILFNVGFSFYLLPMVFHHVHPHPVYAGLCDLFLFLASVLMWWSILSPLPELNPLTGLQRLFYIFITAVMLTPIAFLMLFANDVLYPAYGVATGVFSNLSAVYDQQIAGGILKGFQLTAYGIVLGIVVFDWVRKERQQEKSGKTARVKKAH
ncbi:MAG TPA: cytochrome c oxidase assembly protein [Bacillales bacterium]|nr:cytochrome c oxidase assembly protein [Bacillales bacterium]